MLTQHRDFLMRLTGKYRLAAGHQKSGLLEVSRPLF